MQPSKYPGREKPVSLNATVVALDAMGVPILSPLRGLSGVCMKSLGGPKTSNLLL